VTLLLYGGPAQLIPLSGLLGTVTGLALIFWGKLVRVFFRVASLLSRVARKSQKKSELKATIREPT
jgi:hypothetical protein